MNFTVCIQREFYTLAELQKVPPPQGVDPAKLEAYLSDSNFQVNFVTVYGMFLGGKLVFRSA